jgi:hypothetical protein
LRFSAGSFTQIGSPTNPPAGTEDTQQIDIPFLSAWPGVGVLGAGIHGFHNSATANAYTINADGTLTKIGGIGSGVSAVTLHPTAKYIFNLDGSIASLGAYRVQPGVFAQTDYHFVNGNPWDVKADPSGKWLVMTDEFTNGNSVHVYAFDTVTGKFTELPGSPFGVGGRGAFGAAFESKGKYLAISNGELNATGGATNDISILQFDSTTGRVTPLTGSPFAAGTNPRSLVFVNP